jgi:hypothetical protein
MKKFLFVLCIMSSAYNFTSVADIVLLHLIQLAGIQPVENRQAMHQQQLDIQNREINALQRADLFERKQGSKQREDAVSFRKNEHLNNKQFNAKKFGNYYKRNS